MSDFIPKAGSIKIGGLGPKAQKLQAAREKAAHAKSGAKPFPGRPRLRSRRRIRLLVRRRPASSVRLFRRYVLPDGPTARGAVTS